MKRSSMLIITTLLAILTLAGNASAQSVPPAPSNLSPANGAQVTVPFTISWSAVSDPTGIVGYNWQVSPSSTFSPVILINSTSGQTQDVVSGLANGTYFWRVDALNGDFVTGAWSNTQSFTVTGVNSGEPGSPTLNPPQGGTEFHPFEVIYFNWSAVAGAATYNFDVSPDPSFPLDRMVHFDNITDTNYSIVLGDSWPQGTQYARVSAVNASRIAGVPSNTVTFILSFKAKLPPPPTLLSPADGTIVAFPVTLTWTDVPNPQPDGYLVEIATDKHFNNIEYSNHQITAPEAIITSLTVGTKYWRVLSMQGDSGPDAPANTKWSATGSFIVPSTPPILASLAVFNDTAPSGAIQTVSIQLTEPAPPGGAVINLVSSDPIVAPVPATFTMPAGSAFGQFQIQIGSVRKPTTVTLTATYNSSSASVSFTVQP